MSFALDERTVWRWMEHAGQHCQRVHEQLVSQGQLELGQIQADELKVKTYLGTVWLGIAMQVKHACGWVAGSTNSVENAC